MVFDVWSAMNFIRDTNLIKSEMRKMEKIRQTRGQWVFWEAFKAELSKLRKMKGSQQSLS